MTFPLKSSPGVADPGDVERGISCLRQEAQQIPGCPILRAFCEEWDTTNHDTDRRVSHPLRRTQRMGHPPFRGASYHAKHPPRLKRELVSSQQFPFSALVAALGTVLCQKPLPITRVLEGLDTSRAGRRQRCRQIAKSQTLIERSVAQPSMEKPGVKCISGADRILHLHGNCRAIHALPLRVYRSSARPAFHDQHAHGGRDARRSGICVFHVGDLQKLPLIAEQDVQFRENSLQPALPLGSSFVSSDVVRPLRFMAAKRPAIWGESLRCRKKDDR